jgi:tetratricopeptide (TPR) repeat protein
MIRSTIRSTAARLVPAALLVAVLAGCADSKPPLVSLREKGDYFVETRQDERAVGEYKTFLDRKPEDTEIRYKYAQALSRVGRKPEAREQFSILVDVAPTDERFIDGYTQSLYEANALPELAAFLARMTTQRGSVRDYIRQGEYNLRAGDPDGAKTAYQAAAKIDGGRSTAPWIALADMYRGLGDLRNERAMVERALFIAPLDPVLSARYRTLGGIPGPTAGVRPEEYVEPAKK